MGLPLCIWRSMARHMNVAVTASVSRPTTIVLMMTVSRKQKHSTVFMFVIFYFSSSMIVFSTMT